MELSDDLYNKMLVFTNKGETYFGQQQFDKAIEEYNKALELVPFPQSSWEASVWINTALGDSYFFKKEYAQALDFFYDAYNGPNAVDNPFINLRLGECSFELNNMEKAEDFLMRAYMLQGDELFEREHRKYLNHLKEKYQLDS